MDKKIFFVFENSKNPGLTKGGKKKKKKNTSSDHTSSKNGSDASTMKIDYSLNDIANLEV